MASLGILSLLILTHIADRTIESLLQVAVQDVWFWRISQLLIGASVAYRYLGCPVLAHIAVQKRRRVACRSYCDVRQNSISQFGREGALHVAAIAMCVKTRMLWDVTRKTFLPLNIGFFPAFPSLYSSCCTKHFRMLCISQVRIKYRIATCSKKIVNCLLPLP